MERKQWERQEGETARAFEAFCVYRALSASKRSHRKAHDIFYGENKSNLAQISAWSVANNWVERCKAYDDHLDAERRRVYEEDRLKQREQRQRVVKALQGMAAKVMNAQQQQNMTPGELNSLVNAVSKVLNESRVEFDDLPTQRSEVSGKDGGPVKTVVRVIYEDALPDDSDE